MGVASDKTQEKDHARLLMAVNWNWSNLI